MPGRFYIAPNSIIALLRDIPIDQAQEHTLWFANAEDQANYFYNKQAITLTQQYYVRQGRGVIKVEASADTIYDCNYMMYKNVSFGNKWFYAFITSIEYTNNNTATITFIIDQMQTWFFEMQLGQSFVEREHSATDVPGENLVPEDLETGDFIYTNMDIPSILQGYMIVIAATIKLNTAGTDFENAEGESVSGMYCGLHYEAFNYDAQGIAAANNWLKLATDKGKSDSIVSVFLAPPILLTVGENPYSVYYTYPHRPLSINGYTPRNNKLLTAPYVCMFVKTPTNAAEYAWEYFLNPNSTIFRIMCSLSTSPSAILVPQNYKTSAIVGETAANNYSETLTLNGYPQCAYNIDSYKAWLAQNGASLIVNGVTAVAGLGLGIAQTAVSGGLNMLVQNPSEAGGIVSSLSQIGGMVAQVHEHKILPPHAMGNADGNASLVHGLMNFIFYTKSIRIEYAQIIDQFFDKYGYAMHRVKIPNIHVRERWTYTKTVDCIIHGNLPTEAITEIQNIFNHGVTFWSDVNNVGNYSLRNNPLEVP